MEQKRKTVHLMGTVIDLLIEHVDSEKIINEVIHRLKIYEHRFSANSSDSELMEINRNAGIHPVSVHPELYQLIKIGKKHSCAPTSNLNIAIGPLVQTWRIGFEDAKVPSSSEIEQLLKIIHPQNILLDDEKQTVYLKEKGMLIDLGCLAKGFIADLIVDYLKSVDVKAALINLGGNIVGLGPVRSNKNHFWKVGIQNPLLSRNEYMATLKIFDQSIVTSGIYERNLTSEGKNYHHILNPHTGYPTSTDVASLTIQSDYSVDGEIWTTRLYGKNSEEVIQCLNQLDKIEGLLVTKSGEILFSKGLEESLTQNKQVMQ